MHHLRDHDCSGRSRPAREERRVPDDAASKVAAAHCVDPPQHPDHAVSVCAAGIVVGGLVVEQLADGRSRTEFHDRDWPYCGDLGAQRNQCCDQLPPRRRPDLAGLAGFVTSCFCAGPTDRGLPHWDAAQFNALR